MLDFVEWHPPQERGCANSLKMEVLATSRFNLLRWEGKQILNNLLTTIEDELRAMILMSSLHSSWETFVTTACNASTTAIKYFEVTSAILTEAARRNFHQRLGRRSLCSTRSELRLTDQTTGEEVLTDR